LISITHSSYRGGHEQAIDSVNAYSHETLLVGGYRSAKFSFNVNPITAESWFYNGIGKHIVSYSARSNVAWEGVVNEVSFNIGRRSIKIGPFLDISNRINIGWQYPNYGVEGDPLAGQYDQLVWRGGEEGVSQESLARYGILEEFISGGSSERPAMEKLQTNLLYKLSEPKISESASTSGDSTISISVSCIGYSQLFEKQVYNHEYAGSHFYDLSDKIEAILAMNKFFVGNRVITRDIQPVDIDVDATEEDNRTAWGIIKDHISKSEDPDGVICGMFGGMRFVLQKLSTDVEHYRKAGSSEIYDYLGSDIPVEPAEFLPGGTMEMNDFSKPMIYRVTSVKYDMAVDDVSLNYFDGSLRNVLSGTMLGSMH